MSGQRVTEQPRRLRPEERATILALLGHADFEGRDELLAQVDETLVVGRCGCGCATVELARGEAARGDDPARPIPNEGTVLGPDGEPIGGLLLFVAEGGLAELEVYSFAEEPISVFPPPDALRIHVAPG
jgi:hypothetical protein